MQSFEINAEKRETQGKGASRRLRRVGKVPGILYGAEQGPESIQLEEKELFKGLENEAFYSSILDLKIDAGTQRVVLKDLQRHPYKRQILHLDLQRVDETKKLTIRAPIHFTNEDTCIGVKEQGGVVSHLVTDLEIICLPKDLPEFISVDLAELEVGQTIHLGDLQVPEAVDIATLLHGGDPSAPVVSVHLPKAIEEEVEEGEEEEGETEVAEGEEPAAEE